MATGDGAVVFAGRKGELGNLVEIRHANGWMTRYGHMSSFASGIRAGSRVRQGDVIGYVGQTGVATGPHLHYEMRESNGNVRNPLDIKLPPGEPVPPGSWGKWAIESRGRLGMMDLLDGPPIAVLAEAPDPDDPVETHVEGGD